MLFSQLDYRFKFKIMFGAFAFFLGKKDAVTNQLKKVGEVKVSSPKDRKSGGTEMHQCTSRYYINTNGRSLG